MDKKVPVSQDRFLLLAYTLTFCVDLLRYQYSEDLQLLRNQDKSSALSLLLKNAAMKLNSMSEEEKQKIIDDWVASDE